MAKYLNRISNTVKESLLIHVHVLGVYLPVLQPVDKLVVDWKRGNARSQTQKQLSISPECPIAEFDEAFRKLSIFYREPKRGKY